MDARQTQLQEEKKRLLQRLAEIEVEQQRQRGVYDQVPHYTVLETAARALGQELSRLTQQRAAREVAAGSQAMSVCPECGQHADTLTAQRTVQSLDGPVEMLEPVAQCSACRRAFFPSARSTRLR